MILRGGLGYLLVLVGGLVISVLPSSSPVAGLPLLEDLRASMPGRMLGLSVVVLGLGLGVAAWLELVRYVAHRDRRADAAARGLVLRAARWWTAPLLVAPAMFSRDGWSYAAQGELTRLGLSPYVWAPSVLDGPVVEAVDPRWMDTLTPYGPIPLVWGGLVAEVTGSPWLMVLGHRLLAVAGLLLFAYAVSRMTIWAGRDPVLASALVLPSPLMLAHGVAGLHNDLLMVGLMAFALVVAVEHGWAWGAVLVGLAAAVKLPGGLAGLGVALATLPVTAGRGHRVRRLSSVAAVSVFTLVVVGVASGLGVGWLHALGVPGEVQTPLSLPTQTGRLVGLLMTPLDTGLTTDAVVSAVRALGSLAALVFAGWVAWRAPTGVPAAAVRALALVMLVLVVLGPVVHHWYLLWCVPLLATCHLGPRSGAALLHASWVFGLVAPLDSSLRGAGTVIALGVGLVATVALVQVLVHRASTAGPGVRPDGREGSSSYPASSAVS